VLAALALLGCGGGHRFVNSTGVGGENGFAGAPGFGGSGNPVACTFAVTSSVSPAIETVGIVNWSTTLPDVTRAELRFGLASTGPTMAAPVTAAELASAEHRTLLLGMKANQSYVFRIVAWAGEDSCTSEDYPIESGGLPISLPHPSAEFANPPAHARGFIVTSTGLTGQYAYILDYEGDPVWWAPAPTGPSRANLSWDGMQMYMLQLNVANSGGEVRRVSMDGMTVETHLSGLDTAHHDFTAIPGGVATILWNKSGANAPCAVVERADDGAMTTVVADLGTVYNSESFHANAIHYYPADDSYTVSDRNPNLFVKLARRGELVWQLGGTDPKDPGKFFTADGGDWTANHGHQLLPTGNFLFFANGTLLGGKSMVREYRLDTAAWTATEVWRYNADGLDSSVLGDVQRLPNGNTLVTFSRAGVMQEVAPDGQVVMTLTTSQFGYAEFRESLYGPPSR
jgi:hypothetical protein